LTPREREIVNLRGRESKLERNTERERERERPWWWEIETVKVMS
jgi:hypothetical protein